MSGVTRSRIVGTGSYLPSNLVANAALASQVDTSDEWIVERTGIRQRHIAADGELTSDLAVAAAREALAAAGVTVADLDLIVLATATPDQTFPAAATVVQHKLGMTHGIAFDVAAVCSGYLYALTVADSMLRSGQARTALVIGAETFSRILDWEDRATCVLFGDGAGATVLRAEAGRGLPSDKGVLAARLHSDGRYNDLLYVDGGPSSTGTVGKLRMRGKEVFRHAVTNLAAVMTETLAAAEPRPLPMSPGSSRTRRTFAFSKAPRRSSALISRRWSSPSTATPTPRQQACRWRSTPRFGTAGSKTATCSMLEAMGGGFTWGAAAVRW